MLYGISWKVYRRMLEMSMTIVHHRVLHISWFFSNFLKEKNKLLSLSLSYVEVEYPALTLELRSFGFIGYYRHGNLVSNFGSIQPNLLEQIILNSGPKWATPLKEFGWNFSLIHLKSLIQFKCWDLDQFHFLFFLFFLSEFVYCLRWGKVCVVVWSFSFKWILALLGP